MNVIVVIQSEKSELNANPECFGNILKNFTVNTRSLFPDSIKCICFYNQPCEARPTLNDINPNKPLYCPFTFSVNSCGGCFNTINDPCVHIFVSGKVFNLMPRVYEAKFLVQHES